MMHTQTARALRAMIAVALLGVVLAGCRTYGEYGSTEETFEQILLANEAFAEGLQRARADLNLLEAVAAGDPVLQLAAEKYRTLLLNHEAILAENRELAAHFEEDDLDSYRDLHAAFGAILAEQDVIYGQYAALREAIAELGDTPAPPDSLFNVEPRFTKVRYRYVPLYYQRVRNSTRQLTMREAIRRSGRARPPLDLEAPERLPGSGPPVSDETAGQAVGG